ncbi:hypothetical protein QFZ63_000034 [Streptomyces sp. B3I7]|nr:hypothetical protein [Streptomyces sp. B3I7]
MSGPAPASPGSGHQLTNRPLNDDVAEEFDSLRATLAALQQHFGLSLPRQDVLTGRLTAVVTAAVPPEKLGD